MKAAHNRKQARGDEQENPVVVKAQELVEARYVNSGGFTSNTKKVLVALLQHAGGDAWQNKPHTVTKRQLRGPGHDSTDRVDEALSELARTTLRIRVEVDALGVVCGPNERGMPAWREGAVLADVTYPDAAAGLVRYHFGPLMQQVMKSSHLYADIQRMVHFALDSRYAIAMYELGCAYWWRTQAKGEAGATPPWQITMTTEDLREFLGVGSAYNNWTDLRRKTLEAAKKEIDFLAPFTFDWTAHHKGRPVVAVDLTFAPKSEAAQKAAARAVAETPLVKDLRAAAEAGKRRQGAAPQDVVGRERDPTLYHAIDELRAGKPLPGTVEAMRSTVGQLLTGQAARHREHIDPVAAAFAARAGQVDDDELAPRRKRGRPPTKS
ncbi:replication initiation protein [Paeniroseomonas aquatica]|uniref:Replication initiation protein n=1 Tax=Paeniroseomonas aquatica TaxID=373043 RepID=A0ABT8A9B5_9PROT|nr:replication initiation protein [Paeniroseomonas aquatica]MDN3566011.1 replication initiation protein [Paeniroseomonas aquatica]